MNKEVNYEKSLVLIAVLVLSLLIFTETLTVFAEENAINETTSNETVEIIETTATTNLNLDMSEKYAVDTNLDGTLEIEFLYPVAPDEKIKVTIDGEEITYSIEDILLKHNYTLAYDDVTFEGVDGEKSKILNFTEPGSKFIGVQIPRYAEIDSLSFDISGSAVNTSYPSGVIMDVGNDGQTDWFYIGDFTQFTGEELSSVDLDGTDDGTGYIQDTETYYCELIDLPLGKDFRVSAEYDKVGSNGDIKAVILSVPIISENPEFAGGSDYCDLPESSGSCDISLNYPIEGEYFVCIYSEGSYTEGEYLYSLPIDTPEETDTAYTCPIVEGGICEDTGYTNFFIYAQPAEYDNALQGSATIEAWETFSTSVITAVKYYIGSEPFAGICKSTFCYVPFNITSETEGKLTFSNLQLAYTHSGLTQETSTFYTLQYPQADIEYVESQELALGASIDISLESLEISLSELGDYTIEIEFLGDSVSKSFSILEAEDIFDIITLLDEAEEKYGDYLDTGSEEYIVLKMLEFDTGMEALESEFTTYRYRGDPNIEESARDAALEDLELDLTDLPWEVTFSETFSDVVVIEPSDITSDMGDQTEVYLMQELISVTGTKKTVTVETFAGDSETYTLIHKEVQAEEDIEDATLYEVAPVSFSSLEYHIRPLSDSSNTGEFGYSMSEGGSEDYYYLYAGELDLEDFKTIIVIEGEEEEEEEEPSYFCGDEVCTIPYEDEDSCPADCKSKFPWGWVIGIIILTLIILGLIIFKDKIFKKKKPMASVKHRPPASGSSLQGFVKKEIQKGVPESTIVQHLKKRGWKEEQIKSAISKVKPKKQESEKPKGRQPLFKK